MKILRSAREVASSELPHGANGVSKSGGRGKGGKVCGTLSYICITYTSQCWGMNFLFLFTFHSFSIERGLLLVDVGRVGFSSWNLSCPVDVVSLFFLLYELTVDELFGGRWIHVHLFVRSGKATGEIIVYDILLPCFLSPGICSNK